MPIAFQCPHCGAKTEVADMYAGQTGPCAQCGKPVTIPFTGGEAPVKRGMSGGMLALVIACVVIVILVFCGGILLALLLPAVGSAREAARSAACTNNLRQINLALMSYETSNGSLPPAYTTDKNGKPLLSWRVLILPYLDEIGLYQQIHMDEPWDSPHNAALANQMPMFFRCPSDQAKAGGCETSYFLVTGQGTVFESGKSPRSSDFIRGPSNTVLVVEASGLGVNWMAPTDLDVGNLQTLKSAHSRTLNAAMADGSVQRIDVSSAPEEIRRLATGQ